MKWTRNRFLPVSYVVVLAALVIVGCTSKQEPAEHLTVCGNASCGDLVMVTTDTASDGYHYLNPSLSPDGSRILFSADWWAIPADPKATPDDYWTQFRQILTIPVAAGVEPTNSLADEGGELVKLANAYVQIAGESVYIQDPYKFEQGDPIWQDDEHIIFYFKVDRVGYRIFRAYLNDPGAPAGYASFAPLYLEPSDADIAPRFWTHQSPALSPDGRWLVFIRSGCSIADSLETCTNTSLWALDMSTAGADDGYGALAFPITHEYSRIETPRFAPNSHTLCFSGGLDVDGGNGSGTELYTMELDTTGLAAGTMALDNRLQRVTYTSYAEGDPLVGVLNSSPAFSPDGNSIYFVSTRRAPTTTLHDRNVWRIPVNGSQDPEIFFFSRYDDLDPSVAPDGTMVLSSMVGFPTAMLDRLEEEAYQRIKAENETAHADDPTVALLTETQLRTKASDERRQLEYFAGVMAHLYLYRGI